MVYKSSLLKYFIVVVCFLLPVLSNAQIKINEYSCSNITTTADDYGNHPDWVEFYNAGTSSVNIGGWFFSDKPNTPGKWSFPASTSIPSGGFLRIWCSGKNTVSMGGEIHTNFKLTQCKPDWIILSNGATVVDSLKLRRTQEGHSQGRTPNGASAWKVYTSPTPNSSNTGTAYDGYAPTPIMSPAAGFYNATQNVTVTSLGAGIMIHYTTNGDEPTMASTAYTSPISVAVTTPIRAICYSTNPSVLPSFIETNTYFINETIDQRYGVVSVNGDYTTLFSTQQVQKTSIEYFEKNQFITEAYGTADKHGNDSWAFNQKGFDLVIKDDYGYNNALHHQFFTDPEMGTSKRKEFQNIIMKAGASDNFPGDATVECHMRDAFVQTYAFKKDLELDGRRSKHAITFVNGQYWGVYELREKFDTDYTEYYYDQPKDSIDNLKYWGGLNVEDGSDTGWVNLYNYVMANPMTNPANYAYVDSKLNFKSLIDYMVYNSYVVNSDFINWNSAWWRGRAKNGNKKKWRYWMWDMDNVYDLGENFSGLPTTGMDADPCAYESVFNNAGPNEGHPDILRRLMMNPDFKAMYINRYAELLNTSFKCDSIMVHYNYFKSILTAEMPRHVQKWGGTMQAWQKNMDTLQSKIQQRCSYIESKIGSCYNVTGPYPLTVDVDPPGAGNVEFNSNWLNNFKWSGSYFGNIKMTFEVKNLDPDRYEFDYWEFKNHTPSPSTTDDSVSIILTTSDDVVAHFKEKSSDVSLPTAFTPNGDGVNDILLPLGGRFIKSFSMDIWNRWGQRVYSSTDSSKGWDGYFNGQPTQTGVYAFLLTYTNAKNEEKVVKGNITLIR